MHFFRLSGTCYIYSFHTHTRPPLNTLVLSRIMRSGSMMKVYWLLADSVPLVLFRGSNLPHVSSTYFLPVTKEMIDVDPFHPPPPSPVCLVERVLRNLYVVLGVATRSEDTAVPVRPRWGDFSPRNMYSHLSLMKEGNRDNRKFSSYLTLSCDVP